MQNLNRLFYSTTPQTSKAKGAMMKVRNHTCTKCGMEVELPAWDETRPLYEYFPKVDRAILKHAWQHHREDFPSQFTSLTQFMKWLRTPEGKEWDRKQGLIAEAERIVRGKKWDF